MLSVATITVVCLQLLLQSFGTSAVSWEEWWTYDGISGPQLRVVSTMSVGYNHIDVKEIKLRGILLGNTANICSKAVADVAVLLTLATTRRLHEAWIEMNSGHWKYDINWLLGQDIVGSTVGIVGLGAIGQSIVKRLKAFDVAQFLYSEHKEKSEGPAFWGLINPEWSLCNKGRRQSPVNLEPSKLLFDPNLRLLHVDKHRVSGSITNTGHSVIFTVENDTRHHINVTGGPLSYKYQFHEIHIHYGLHDQFGSEHSINGYAFPAEIQIFGFNSQLYSNFSEALHRAQGIAVISLLLQLGDLSNPELRILTEQLDKIRYGGMEMPVKRLSIRGLLPDTDYYMTYDGSTTMPACHETVTWLILNKPIYITKQQLHSLRRLMQGDEKHPKAPLGNNFRPPQPLHNRPIRTNIDFNVKKGQPGSKYCPSMYKDVYYKANSWKQH